MFPQVERINKNINSDDLGFKPIKMSLDQIAAILTPLGSTLT